MGTNLFNPLFQAADGGTVPLSYLGSTGTLLELDLCIDGVDCLRVLAKLCNREQLSAVHKLRVRLTDQSLLVEVLAALPKLRQLQSYNGRCVSTAQLVDIVAAFDSADRCAPGQLIEVEGLWLRAPINASAAVKERMQQKFPFRVNAFDLVRSSQAALPAGRAEVLDGLLVRR